MCINHWADSTNFKGITLNELCSGFTGNCFEMPNASYPDRWQTLDSLTIFLDIYDR